jgi:ubiquitin C-terminal hydrolase
MNWTVVNQHGLGLDNSGQRNNQQNKCYLNAIVQCLANTAPFAQWLLYDAEDNQCMYAIS